MKYLPAFMAAMTCSIGLTMAATAETTVIHAGHLIAEPGKPEVINKSIIIEDGVIKDIKDGFVEGDTLIDLKDAWVMPGLIDMHTHITGVLNLAEPTAPQIAYAYIAPPAQQVLKMIPRVKSLLMNGFTTVRVLGDQSGTAYYLRDAINEGAVEGPRMYVAEVQVAVDGGDMDPSNWDVRHEVEPFVSNRASCTGVVECTKVVRLEVRRGADVIKLRQAGLPAEDPNVAMVETPEEIKAIVDTAHQLNRRVAAHVVGSPDYLHMVIEAGVDTIEHGPVDDTSIKLMKKHGTSYTPTLLAGKMIQYRFEDGQAGVAKAYKAGVPIIFGSDLGIMSTDKVHEEFGLLAGAGMPPQEVLKAATVNAAAALGRAKDLGVIAIGASADIIAMPVNPVSNIEQVGEPGKVTFVMKEGTVFKGAK
ncbi:amidohydrolase family protein [Kordiimonas pumila]|uniref:Amidohydrolase family protein n=1 Tax=Kordiimonas pumila TaxID=2161677 RepID=A0ABV7D4Q3_9PROT|nr:amidohydrolase family protein [Kordiimonas pumila]